MEGLEKAVLVQFNTESPAAAKEAAEAYIASARQQPEHWKDCVRIFGTTQYQEVQFWCLQTLLQAVEHTKLTHASEEDKRQLNLTVLAWAFGTETVTLRPIYIQNKLAQLLAHLAAENYMTTWRSFFQDILAVYSAVPDMLLRVLLAVDEDIISLDIPRTDAAARRSMDFKDAMREADIHAVLEVCMQIVGQWETGDTGLMSRCLLVLQRYTSWVDIQLIATPVFVQMLFKMLAGPSALRGAAADALGAIVSKRMDPIPKLQLVHQIGALPVVCACAAQLQADSEDAARLAALLNSLAFEVIESCKRTENQMISMKALGLAVDDAAVAEVAEVTSMANTMLQQLVPAALTTLQHNDGNICLACIPFLNAFLARTKNAARRAEGLEQESQQTLFTIMQGIAVASRYPADSHSYSQAPPSPEVAVLAEDEENAMEEQRAELYVVLRNSAKLIPQAATQSVHDHLRALADAPPADVTWQDVEVAVAMLYELGEALVDEVNLDGCGIFQAPVLLIMEQKLPHREHRLVAGALLECFVRYVRVAAKHASVLPKVMHSFLNECGLAHPNQTLSTRACYLLMRIVKVLRPNLKDYLHELIEGLTPRVAAVAANPVMDTSFALKGTQPRGASGPAFQLDDRLYAWEAMSLLLASDEISADTQALYLQVLLEPLCTQIQMNLEGEMGGLEVMGTSPQAVSYTPFRPLQREPKLPNKVMLINQALEAVSRLSKGFSLDRMTRLRRKVGELFKSVVPVAMGIPTRLPHNKLLRKSCFSYLHRMVECLGRELVSLLPAAFVALAHDGCDASDLADVLRLLNQLVVKFPNDIQELLTEVLPPICARVHEILAPAQWDWTGGAAVKAATDPGGQTGSTEWVRERSDLQIAYHALVSSLVGYGMLPAMASMGVWPAVFDTTLRAASAHKDMTTRKTCLATLQKALGSSEILSKEQKIRGVGVDCCFRAVLSGGVDIRDAGVLGLLNEVTNTVMTLMGMYKDEFMSNLQAFVQSEGAHVCAKEDLWVSLLEAMNAQHSKAFKDALKAIMRARQGIKSRLRPDAQ